MLADVAVDLARFNLRLALFMHESDEDEEDEEDEDDEPFDGDGGGSI